MFILYCLTLLFPLGMAFFLDDMDADDAFFSVFSLNKVLIFINGMLLAEVTGFNPVVGLVFGGVELALYVFSFRLIKSFEHKTSTTVLLPGATGFAYNSIDQFDGMIRVNGENFKARLAAGPYRNVEAFTDIVVIQKNNDTYIVDELISKE